MLAKTIETINGKSKVFKDGDYLFTATYKIDLKQASPDSQYEITGTLTIQENERMNTTLWNLLDSGAILTMQLEKPFSKIEFSKINFYVRRLGQHWDGVYQIINASL